MSCNGAAVVRPSRPLRLNAQLERGRRERGQRTATAEDVVAGWLTSAGHCVNIMGATYTEMGIASAVNTRDHYGMYWTMSLAAHR